MAGRAISANITGGDAIRRHLKHIEKQLGAGAAVKVGFLESATYTGERASRPVPRGTSKEAKFARFVHQQKGFTGPVAQVALWNEYGTSRAPARPFMRFMVASKSPRWGIALGYALRRTDYDARAALAIMGEGISGQLKQSINEWKDPPNSPYTVAVKGFNKPLVDSAQMLNAVDFQVVEDDGG